MAFVGWILLFSHIRMHTNGRKPLTIVQDKQKETYKVDLVLVVEEKHTIECPTLMFWVVINVSQAFVGWNLLFSHIRMPNNGHPPLTIVQGKQKETYFVDLLLVVSHIRMNTNGRMSLTIVQDKHKQTYTVDLVWVVEENHTIECPTLMLWLLIRQACGVKAFVFTHQNAHQRPQTSDHCTRQPKANIYGGFRSGS
jgi:hypothetical protein